MSEEACLEHSSLRLNLSATFSNPTILSTEVCLLFGKSWHTFGSLKSMTTRRVSTLFAIFAKADTRLADRLLRELVALQKGAALQLIEVTMLRRGWIAKGIRQHYLAEAAALFLLSPDF